MEHLKYVKEPPQWTKSAIWFEQKFLFHGKVCLIWQVSVKHQYSFSTQFFIFNQYRNSCFFLISVPKKRPCTKLRKMQNDRGYESLQIRFIKIITKLRNFMFCTKFDIYLIFINTTRLSSLDLRSELNTVHWNSKYLCKCTWSGALFVTSLISFRPAHALNWSLTLMSRF